jgi:Zn-finger nucleic acid-binding protein
MKCPACKRVMVEEDFGQVHVDVCKDGCKGIWFDWGELSRLNESHEGVGKAMEEALNSPRVIDAHRDPLACPKCGITMQTHKYSSAKEVTVDECYACGGFFLDSGELKVIRDQYMDESERDAYVQKLLNETTLEKKTGRAKLRANACHALGGLLSRRWPFVWP